MHRLRALYERLGATSLNVSTDLPIRVLAEIRAVTTVPIDMYIEVPDDQGGHVRFYDVPEWCGWRRRST